MNKGNVIISMAIIKLIIVLRFNYSVKVQSLRPIIYDESHNFNELRIFQFIVIMSLKNLQLCNRNRLRNKKKSIIYVLFNIFDIRDSHKINKISIKNFNLIEKGVEYSILP